MLIKKTKQKKEFEIRQTGTEMIYQNQRGDTLRVIQIDPPGYIEVPPEKCPIYVGRIGEMGVKLDDLLDELDDLRKKVKEPKEIKGHSHKFLFWIIK